MDATEAAAVLARARQGDSEAFRVLVERHGRSVFRLAYRMTGNEQDAEDVVQESFLRAYKQIGRFESRANFGTWLYRIVANCSVDLMRAKQARHDQVRGDSLDELADLPAGDLPGPERLARSASIERHLADCAACRATYHAIAGTLAMVAPPEPPERGDQYGLEVWQRIRHQLPPQEDPWWNAWLRWDRLALAGAAAALVLAAFV